MREFRLQCGLTVTCKNDKDRIFCEHCSDLFYDSKGIYMTLCDLGKKTSTDCMDLKELYSFKCEDFKDYEKEG